MLYYQALKDGYDYFNKNAVIKGELLTAKERNSKVRYLPDFYFQQVEISRQQTFTMFGVRFPKDDTLRKDN